VNIKTTSTSAWVFVVSIVVILAIDLILYIYVKTRRGIWKLEQQGEWVNVVYDWKIRADKPLLRTFSFLLKPVFSANHHWAMRMGEKSLKLELMRRHTTTLKERALIPPPPGPTFMMWIKRA